MLAARDIAKARHQCLTIDRYLSQDGELFIDSHVKFMPGLAKNCDGTSVSKIVFYQTERPGELYRQEQSFPDIYMLANFCYYLTKCLVSNY